MKRSTARHRSVSFVNLALGLWLFVSAFAWPHARPHYYNAWIVGALATLAAAVAVRLPHARWLNTGLGSWLFLSTWLYPSSDRTTWWNHVVVGALLVVVSLVPGRVGETEPTVHTYGSLKRRGRSLPDQ